MSDRQKDFEIMCVGGSGGPDKEEHLWNDRGKDMRCQGRNGAKKRDRKYNCRGRLVKKNAFKEKNYY